MDIITTVNVFANLFIICLTISLLTIVVFKGIKTLIQDWKQEVQIDISDDEEED